MKFIMNAICVALALGSFAQAEKLTLVKNMDFLSNTLNPTTIDLDALTVRQVLRDCALDTTKFDSAALVVTSVSVVHKTTTFKCTGFVSGPGSCKNCNFTATRAATNADLGQPVWGLALNLTNRPLGLRCLLFAPPNTEYKFIVTYRDVFTKRTATDIIRVAKPTSGDVGAMAGLGRLFPVGVTQMPWISDDVHSSLASVLAQPASLDALLKFETILGTSSVDATVIRNAKNAEGKYDARSKVNYLVDGAVQPLACLLQEMAGAALPPVVSAGVQPNHLASRLGTVLLGLDMAAQTPHTEERANVSTLYGRWVPAIFVSPSVRGVLIDNNVLPTPAGFTPFVQAVRVTKATSAVLTGGNKSTGVGFVTGTGAGLNTNFDTGLKSAGNQDLDRFVWNVALGQPGNNSGPRGLLFSPPGTVYTMSVVSVLRDDATGKILAPVTVSNVIKMKRPTVTDVKNAIAFFQRIPYGVTQRPLIDSELAKAPAKRAVPVFKNDVSVLDRNLPDRWHDRARQQGGCEPRLRCQAST